MMKILILQNAPDTGSRIAQTVSRLGCSGAVCLNCADRAASLGRIARKKPDVVLYDAAAECLDDDDVNMLREIRRISGKISTVILCDMSNRQNMKIALECDAEWVLPWDCESDLIGLVLQRIERKVQTQNQQTEENLSRIFLKYIKNEGRLSYQEENQLQQNCSGEKLFKIAVVRVLPPYRRRTKINENNPALLKAYELLQNRLEKLTRRSLVKDGQDFLVCFMGEEADLQRAKVQLSKFLQDMREFNATVSRAAAWVFLGRTVDSVQSMPDSYQSAFALIPERLLGESLRILEAGNQMTPESSKNQKERYRIFDVRKTVANALVTFEEIAIHKSFTQLKSNIQSTVDFTGEDVYAIYKTLSAVVFRELEQKEIAIAEFGMDYDSSIGELNNFWNMEDVFNSLEQMYVDAINMLKTQEENCLPAPIVLAKRYIRGYFNMPLTLQEISEYVGMNENYFSDYFRKYASMTFKQYQTDLRIRHAKQMLLDKQYSMDDIAEAVGYNDTKYFSRVFKQTTGIAPGEYRKKYHIVSD